jgi:hypothetical protein
MTKTKVQYVPDCIESYVGDDNSNPEANLEKILRYYTGKGLSLAVAAGIAGNYWRESGYLPAKIQNSGVLAPSGYTPVNGVGFGLAQWTYNSRQLPLVEFAKDRNADIIGLYIQLDYSWEELTTSYSRLLTRLESIKSEDTFGINNTTSAPMAAAIMFHGTTTEAIKLEYANGTVAKEFLGLEGIYGYESSAGTSHRIVENRGIVAEEVYEKYKGIINDGNGISDTDMVRSSYANNLVQGDCNEPSNTTPTNTSGTNLFGIPDNVTRVGDGWKLINGQDYSHIPCEGATDSSVDAGTYTHPIHGTIIRLCYIQDRRVASIIYARLTAMLEAAKKDGVDIKISSGFRSYERQAELYEANCGSGSRTCNPPTAKPGTSNHETGIAVDFHSIDRYARNNVGNEKWYWLIDNSYDYGFFQLNVECWHWSPVDDGKGGEDTW